MAYHTVREINALIRAEFKGYPGFLPAKAMFAGSVPAIRFEGDLPVSLAWTIARRVEQAFPGFIDPVGDGRGAVFHIGWVNGGTVLNWLDR